jgi:hypothetical protein
MSLTDLFSKSTLFCLGITLLIIGLITFLFMQKINDQNHKISSMVGLVSTMAEEVSFMRSRMQILSSGIPNGGNREIDDNNFISHSSDSLIHVSDDEEDSTDDNDSSDDESTDDDSDDNDEDDSSGDDENEILVDVQNIRTINMGESIINNNLFKNNVDDLNNEFDDELNDEEIEDLNDNELEELTDLLADEICEADMEFYGYFRD